MHILNNLVSIVWFIFIVYWFFSALFVKKNAKGRDWTREAIIRIFIIALVVAIYNVPGGKSFVSSQKSTNLAFQIIGIMLFLTGILLAVWARVNLGKNWGSPMTLK